MVSDIIEDVRRIVAEDSVHSGVRHEVYLTPADMGRLERSVVTQVVQTDPKKAPPPSMLGLPLFTGRLSCVLTIRDGAVISTTILKS